MTDLTKITTPFGLLGNATRNCLMDLHAKGGLIDIWDYDNESWRNCISPRWLSREVYRLNLGLPQPLVIYTADAICTLNGMIENKFTTHRPKAPFFGVRVRKFIEVIE